MDVLERLRRGYATFNAREKYDPGDFTADFVLEQTPTIFDSAGRFEGVDGLYRAQEELVQGFDLVRFDPKAFDVQGDHVVVSVVVTTSTRGVEQTAHVWHVWDVRETKLARLRVFDTRAGVTEALG